MAIDLAQVEALAPDQASLDAARRILKPSSWPTLATDGAGLAWGEAQGSGATPYRVVVCEGDAGSKCTCPSRKFPCKHALALMWLRAEGRQPFAPAEPPGWVQDWLGRRRGSGAARPSGDAPRASLAAALAPQDVAAPAPGAEARGQAQRERNQREREAAILTGLDELELWLQDQLERGVAAFVPDSASACRKMGQRLVDAKAGGLATRLDSLPSRLFALAEPSRPRAALEELGLFFLLAEAYRRQERLAPPMRDDIRQMIGWPRSRDDLLSDPAALRVAGTWHVFATRNIVQPDRLRRLETWLLRNGEAGAPRFALLLDFVPVAGGASASTLLPDDAFEGELVFFGASVPLRAIVGLQSGPTRSGSGMPPLPDQTLGAAFAEYQAMLAARPWLDEWPLAFRGASLRRREQDYVLVDTVEGLALPVAPDQNPALWALAQAAGIDGIGLWDGRHLRLAQASTPLGRWVDR